ncbi:MAG TPA: MGMT family protein [Candidatus Methanomethylicus sp.]|nr:MGMT family protein [Candidatus Methanomethylicus sp.]
MAVQGTVYLSSVRVNGMWVTVAFGESGALYACSIPSKEREPSRSLTIKALAERGFSFIGLGCGDPRAFRMGEAVYRAGIDGGSDLPLSFEGMTAFRRRVLELAREIPRGAVSSYGDLAAAAGNPRAARAVGSIMANNPFPWVVPCHRVVRSDLSIGGFGGGPPEAWDLGLKAALLRSEGVELYRGKVRARHRLARGK